MNTANSVQEAELPLLLICLLNYSDYYQFYFSYNLSSNKDIGIKQLKTLGVSRLQLFKIRIAEGNNTFGVNLSVSSSFNLIILILVIYWPTFLGRSLVDISGFWQPSLIVCQLFFMVFITKRFYYFKIDKLEQLLIQKNTLIDIETKAI